MILTYWESDYYHYVNRRCALRCATAHRYLRHVRHFLAGDLDVIPYIWTLAPSARRQAHAALRHLRDYLARGSVFTDGERAHLEARLKEDAGDRRDLQRETRAVALRPRERQAVRPEELADLIERARESQKRCDADDQTIPALLLGALAGLRRGDMLRLRWRDVDLQRGRIHLDDPKGGRPYVVPLARRLRSFLWSERLRREPQPDHYVVGREYPTSAPTLSRRLKGIGLVPHALRRGFATALLDRGEPIQRVAKLMNHRQTSTTERYYYPSLETLQGALEDL